MFVRLHRPRRAQNNLLPSRWFWCCFTVKRKEGEMLGRGLPSSEEEEQEVCPAWWLLLNLLHPGRGRVKGAAEFRLTLKHYLTLKQEGQ